MGQLASKESGSPCNLATVTGPEAVHRSTIFYISSQAKQVKVTVGSNCLEYSP